MVAPGAPDGLSAPAGGAPRGRFLPDQPIKIPMKRIQVLVVDDSAVVRQVVSALLAQDPEIEVMAAVADPILAMARMATQWPDVIVLDIEMPRMDGLTFLRRLTKYHPIPTIILSSLTETGGDLALACLDAGAFEVRSKPNGSYSVGELAEDLIELIRGSVGFDPRVRRSVATPAASATSLSMIDATEKVVVIGASTGGTQALAQVLSTLPADIPGIAIVQHMPEQFTQSFAARLDRTSKPQVSQAQDGDRLAPGRVLIAPGGKQMKLVRDGAQFAVRVVAGPRVCRHAPSVEVLFQSAARCAGVNAMGVIMTGMGDDGANGLEAMHRQGAFTVAQDEASCVVFGMPKEAIRRGAVDEVVGLDQISDRILRFAARKLARSSERKSA